MRFAPHTEDDISEMLATLGLSSVDDLFADIPRDVRLDRPLDIPAGVSEMELIADMRALASRNLSTDQLVCFAGGGAYDHYIPSVVWAFAGRSEFYTSYTPYQPELSQGVLQTLFEFQSMICELTGLEVSNASLYDGATALVEAVNMARGHGRDRVLVSSAVDPRLVDTLHGRDVGEQVVHARKAEGREHLADVVLGVRREPHERKSTVGLRVRRWAALSRCIFQAVLGDEREVVALVEDLASDLRVPLTEPPDLAVLLRDELLVERRDLDVEVVVGR